jgi:capsular exopolysaccharide synthesis family protein
MNDSKQANRKSLALALPARLQPVSRTMFVAGGGSGSPEADTVSNAWRAIRHGKYLVLACVAGGLLLAIAVSGLQKPMYQGETILEVRDPAHVVSPFAPATATSDAAGDSTVVTEISLLHSEALIRSVVQRLGLDRQPGFAPATDSTQLFWRALRHQTLPPEPPADRAVKVAEHNLSIRHQARIIELDYDSSDPELAANFVNTLVQEHLRQSSLRDAGSVRQLREWLDRETADLGQKLAKSESEMQGYAERSGIVQTDSHDIVTEQQLRLLSEELGRAEADRMIKQSRATVAASAPAEVMPQVVDDPVLRDYQTKLTDLKRQSQELQALLTPQNYKVQQVENQITVLEAAIKKELADVRTRAQNDYRAAQERENLLKSRFAAESRNVTTQEGKFVHYGTLQQELETTRAMHSELLEKAQQLGLTSAAPNTDLRVVSSAVPPTRPYSPNYLLNLSLGAFVGIFAGIAAAIAREQIRPRIRAPGDSSLLLQLPEIAAIPCIDRRQGMPYLPAPRAARLESRLELAAWNGGPSLLTESIHDALASIMAQCDRGSRVILFTSPSPGDGKTTIVANLAISLAMCHRRVLLIDGDLRRPRMHRIFNVPFEPGLAEALRDDAQNDLREVEKVYALPIPDLFLMTSGKVTANYAPLLAGMRLAQVLGRMRPQFDVILIDAPPVLHGPDARLLGRLADGAILITRARKTSHQDAVAAASRLAADKVPLMGTILNDWNPRSDAAAYTSYMPAEPETLLQ